MSLEINGLEVGYRRRQVLSGISLPSFADGEMVGLLGPNAAGKSTLLKALAGQLSYAGSARLRGVEMSTLTYTERARRIGYAPQTPPQPSSLLAFEYALSALKAALPGLSRQEAEARIEKGFARFGLEAFALRSVQELSGGKRQLLGLALLAARDTQLQLLDEPTSALDMRWELEALHAFRALSRERGSICLVALHDLNLALRYCDQIVLLTEGRVLAAGPSTATLTPDLLRRAYGVEARIETCSQGRPIVLADAALSVPVA